MVNGEGSRCLMRYLIDRGCRKFVMASSIAAVGCQSVRFRPEVLPIPDEHPCYDLYGYGFSKFIMEEITKYHWRQNPEIDVVNIRLCSVMRDEVRRRKPEGVRPILEWTVGNVTCMLLSDAIRAFSLAALGPVKPGVRILNTAAERIWATVPTAEFPRELVGRRFGSFLFPEAWKRVSWCLQRRSVKRRVGFQRCRYTRLFGEHVAEQLAGIRSAGARSRP